MNHSVAAWVWFGEMMGMNGGAGQPVRFRLTEVRDLLDCGRSIYTGSGLTSSLSRDIAEAADVLDPTQLPTELKVEFVTPTAIENRNPKLRDPATGLTILNDFYSLVLNLALRVGGLWQLYGNEWRGQAEYFRWRERLLKASRSISTLESNLALFRDTRGSPLKRHSSRQQADQPLDGFIGTMRFAGDLIPFWQLLRIGEIVHMGGDTANGLGQYKLIY